MFFPRVFCRCHLRHEEFLYRSASAGGGRSRHSASKILDNLKAEYGKGVDEESVRFGNFKANVHITRETNAPNLTYTLCTSSLILRSESLPQPMGLVPSNLRSGLPHWKMHEYDGAPLGSSVDWTAQGVVTSVRNEAQCGSCLTSSTTGALELTEASRTGHLVSPSEQEFVSRDTDDSKCEQCLRAR